MSAVAIMANLLILCGTIATAPDLPVPTGPSTGVVAALAATANYQCPLC